jgi:uncharacterized protein
MRLPIFLFAALILSGTLLALQMPSAPEHRVNDYAGVLSPQDEAALEIRSQKIEENTSNQIVTAIFPKSEGEDIDDFANRLYEKWHLGQKKNNNGVLLLVFLEDRKVRIEVGYGLEGALTDALASEIIRNEIAPAFREGQYAKGLNAAVDAIDRATRGEYKGKGPSAPYSGNSYQLIVFILVLLLVIWISRRRRNSGVYLPGQSYRRRGSPWIFFPGGGWSDRSDRGSGWGGGGGFSGGGFSGGGGLSGGGGASGSW